ncbi:DNA methyltransferase [Nannocystis pusilla]|uniref:DNA methyltransferase n=1 Tax=Nannocystis pusilla TaxID=889268 RepID=UPI003B80A9E5
MAAARGRLARLDSSRFSREKTGWATQKNESLLRRIVAASSDSGALVADFFCGAGTTLAAAQALGRRWIGCDSAAAAIELAHARMAERQVPSSCGPGSGRRSARSGSRDRPSRGRRRCCACAGRGRSRGRCRAWSAIPRYGSGRRTGR